MVLQSNLVNTNSDEAIKRVLINSVSLLSGSCYSTKTVKKKPNRKKSNERNERGH